MGGVNEFIERGLNRVEQVPIAGLPLSVARNVTMGPGASQLPLEDQLARLIMTYGVARMSPGSLPALHQSYGQQTQTAQASYSTPAFQERVKELMAQGMSQEDAIRQVHGEAGVTGIRPPPTLPPLSAEKQLKSKRARAKLDELEEFGAAVERGGPGYFGHLARLRRAQGRTVPPDLELMERNEIRRLGEELGMYPEKLTAGGVEFEPPAPEVPAMKGPPAVPGSDKQVVPAEDLPAFAESARKQAEIGNPHGIPIEDQKGAISVWRLERNPDGTITRRMKSRKEIIAEDQERQRAEAEVKKQVTKALVTTQTQLGPLDAMFAVLDSYITKEAFPAEEEFDNAWDRTWYTLDQYQRSSSLPFVGGVNVKGNRALNEYLAFVGAGVTVYSKAFGEVRPTDADRKYYLESMPKFDEVLPIAKSKVASAKLVVWAILKAAHERAGKPFNVPIPATGFSGERAQAIADNEYFKAVERNTGASSPTTAPNPQPTPGVVDDAARRLDEEFARGASR